ncbi:MAG: NADH-quinone oxidoreductase subunit C [Methanolinea sp.]|jgi:ech hydrogenase subunit D|nr:NADH-quinone oxidoreductase subunit C [Methanolinea sp.]
MTIEEQTTTVIERDHLIGRVEEFKKQGYRLVQMSCTKVGDLYEINYSFDLNYQFRNLRIVMDGQTEIASISGIYWGAFVYENEMHDLFGIRVVGMNVDFGGNLIRTAKKNPFANPTFRGEGPCPGE